MIQVIVMTISTFVILISSLGCAWSSEIEVDVYVSYKFILVAIAIAYAIGYQLIYKEWRMKKLFLFIHVIPIVLCIGVNIAYKL